MTEERPNPPLPALPKREGGGESEPNPPAPFPNREGGASGLTLSDTQENSNPQRSSPPSLLGKGAGGLGARKQSSAILAVVLAAVAVGFVAVGFTIWYFAIRTPEPKD